MTARFIIGDTRDVVASLPAGSVDLILTSPPFLALRSYLPADHPDKAREIGSEPTPAAFLDTLLELTALWGRALAPHGSIAVELGDTYSGSGGAGGDYADDGLRAGQERFNGAAAVARAHAVKERTRNPGLAWPLAKSLALVPELYRIALAYGINPLTGQPSPAGRWMVRNVVRWVRPNPPVGALGDKFRPATSDLVIATRDPKRWFDLDAVRTEHQRERDPNEKNKRRHGPGYAPDDVLGHQFSNGGNPAGAPPLDWWEIVPKGYEGSHYATFPPELCVKPIEAMCPRRVCRTCGTPSRREVEQTSSEYAEVRRQIDDKFSRPSEGVNSGFTKSKAGSLLANGVVKPEYTTTGWSSCGCPGTDGIRLDGFHTGPGWRPGIVLDPFGGTGTTGMVATGHGRDAILVDLDDRNADLARDRIGMFLTVETHQTSPETAPQAPYVDVPTLSAVTHCTGVSDGSTAHTDPKGPKAA